MPVSTHTNKGYTYVELLIAVTMSALLVVGIAGVVNTSLDAADQVTQRTELTRKVADAMADMRRAVAHSRLLMLPLADNPETDWPENIREQTIPASAPPGSSTLATAVLSVTLPVYFDLDNDGTPDADNDADGLLDEDPPRDMNADGKAGIAGIDDNGDGIVDNSVAAQYDDDEDGRIGIEVLNGIDDDKDGSIDEDLGSDLNGDGQSGAAGVDDDGDGSVDEADVKDDDEDGLINEDRYDTLVYYLEGDALKRRTPVPWDADASGTVDGNDHVTSTLVEHVKKFGVTRLVQGSERWPSVELTLGVAVPGSDETIALTSRVRVGGAL